MDFRTGQELLWLSQTLTDDQVQQSVLRKALKSLAPFVCCPEGDILARENKVLPMSWGKPSYEELEDQVKNLEQELKTLREKNVWSGSSRSYSPTMYKVLAENSVDVIWCVDQDCRYTFVSPSVSSMFGYTQQEILGQDVWLTLPDEEVSKVQRSLEWMYAHNKELRHQSISQALELVQIRKDGSRLWTEVFCTSLKDPWGGIIGFQGTTRDITERKQAEEALRISQERFMLAMEASRDGIWDWNVQTDEVYYSPAYMAMLGYSMRETAQDSDFWKSLIHPHDRKDVLAVNTDCIESRREDFEIEFRMQARDGQWRWILGKGKAVARDAHGRATRMVGTHSDITSQKDLQQLKNDVEQVMRHDLKGAVSSVMGLPQVLEGDDNLTQEQKNIVTTIKNAGLKMQRMIDFSLQMLEIEKGTYQCQPREINVLDSLSQVIDQNYYHIQGKNLEVKTSVQGKAGPAEHQVQVWVEEQLLYFILSNLLINAIEASPKGETLCIDVCNSQPTTVLNMTNKGAVPQAMRSHFFEKYRTYGKDAGTGLGTYSAKLMAEAMNCTIDMQSSDAADMTRVRLFMPVSRGSADD